MSKHRNESTTPESEKDLSQTPRALIDLLEKQFSVEFVLDVAANKDNRKAPFYIDKDMDALNCDWKDAVYKLDTAAIWCNPPFGTGPNPIKAKFLRKAIEESKKGCIVFVLIPASGAKWHQELVEQATTVLIPSHRIEFLRADGTRFLNKEGKPQGADFDCEICIFTPFGNSANRVILDTSSLKNTIQQSL